MQTACLERDDLLRFDAGFTPHLSVGQAGSTKEPQRLRDTRQATWEPICFELSAVAVLRREPDTAFEVARWVALGPGGT